MRLGYSTWGMPEVPIDAAIPHVARLGYEGIELAVTAGHSTELSTLSTAETARIAGLLREHRLALPSLAAHSTLLAETSGERAEVMRRLRRACDVAAELAQGSSTPAVATTLGGQPPDWPRVRHLLAERIAELAHYAAGRSVTIALEPHVGNAVDTPARTVELLRLVDLPNVLVNFDISHYEVVGIPMTESISALAGHAVHAHVKDQRGVVPAFEFLIPGEGEFDYVEYLRQMASHGYRGFVTVEISVMVQRRTDYDPLAAAARAYATLAAAFRRSGIRRDLREC